MHPRADEASVSKSIWMVAGIKARLITLTAGKASANFGKTF